MQAALCGVPSWPQGCQNKMRLSQQARLSRSLYVLAVCLLHITMGSAAGVQLGLDTGSSRGARRMGGMPVEMAGSRDSLTLDTASSQSRQLLQALSPPASTPNATAPTTPVPGSNTTATNTTASPAPAIPGTNTTASPEPATPGTNTTASPEPAIPATNITASPSPASGPRQANVTATPPPPVASPVPPPPSPPTPVIVIVQPSPTLEPLISNQVARLSNGVIAGIVIACIVFTALVIAGTVFLCRRWRREQDATPIDVYTAQMPQSENLADLTKTDRRYTLNAH